ncbi:MAG: C69 family dipeptidase [Gammaproteobacteria bacterium]|nr:C69 family dipeptidase [Gammaproteobacteria bacterium]
MKQETECTTILVGQSMMADNSMIVARSADSNALISRHLKIYKATDNGPEEFKALDSPFQCKLPQKALGYTSIERCVLPGHWGSAGFNTANVGMSATESIFTNEKALEADPFKEDGVAENSVFNIVLPYISTAREGIERLGQLIEEHGTAQSFGIAFVDSKEIWYLESAGGHRWLAARIPDDMYFVTANQGRLRDYNPEDTENFMASEDLIEFAIANKLYNPDHGKFDFHEAYSREVLLDTTYNYPRVWGIQKMLSPSISSDVSKNTFPVFAQSDSTLTLSDIRTVLRFHYQGTEHDPYANNNPDEPYRPVSIFRTAQTHILHVRPELPLEISQVNYINLGMATLGVYIPFYHGMEDYLEAYTIGDQNCSDDSAYWKFRKVQTLGMTNYNKYAPIIQKAYLEWENETDQRQKEMEYEYLQLCAHQPLKAKRLIQQFSEETMQSAMDLADELTNELFTQMTFDIQKEYKFSGA